MTLLSYGMWLGATSGVLSCVACTIAAVAQRRPCRVPGGFAPLTVVQPLGVFVLVFGMPWAARLEHRRVSSAQ